MQFAPSLPVLSHAQMTLQSLLLLCGRHLCCCLGDALRSSLVSLGHIPSVATCLVPRIYMHESLSSLANDGDDVACSVNVSAQQIGCANQERVPCLCDGHCQERILQTS